VSSTDTVLIVVIVVIAFVAVAGIMVVKVTADRKRVADNAKRTLHDNPTYTFTVTDDTPKEAKYEDDSSYLEVTGQ